MKAILTTAISLVLSGGFVLPGLPAQGPPQTGNQEQNIQAYVDLLRTDVTSQKVAIISQMMQFTPEEASVFWPVYSEYDKELAQLGDRRVALIKDYADHYGAMTDEKADELVAAALDLRTRRVELLKRFHKRLRDVLSGKGAAKLVQVENQLLTIIDLQVQSSLPIVQ